MSAPSNMPQSPMDEYVQLLAEDSASHLRFLNLFMNDGRFCKNWIDYLSGYDAATVVVIADFFTKLEGHDVEKASAMLDLGLLNMRGSYFRKVYIDLCGQNVDKMIKVMRAAQLDYFNEDVADTSLKMLNERHDMFELDFKGLADQLGKVMETDIPADAAPGRSDDIAFDYAIVPKYTCN